MHELSKQPAKVNFQDKLKALSENDGRVLLMGYDEVIIGRVFLLAYRAEAFMDLLDSLSECVDLNGPLATLPAVNSMVVAKMKDPDAKDNLPTLKGLGGLFNKPWRAFIRRRLSPVRALLEFIDIPVTQEVTINNIYRPSDAVCAFSTDSFGGWAYLRDAIELQGDNRRFYLGTYKNLMDKLIYNYTTLTDLELQTNEPPKSELSEYFPERYVILTAKVMYKWNQRKVGELIKEKNQWNYETIIKNGIYSSSLIMHVLHGPSSRILFKDIEQVLTYHQQMLSTDPKCVERCNDDMRVWSYHVEKYVGKAVPATNWFPQIGEVFLLYTEDEKSGKWRRVVRLTLYLYSDLDDHNCEINMEGRGFERYFQAPMELIYRPSIEIENENES